MSLPQLPTTICYKLDYAEHIISVASYAVDQTELSFSGPQTAQL